MICDIITQPAPVEVSIAGKMHPINWDFRAGIEFDAIRDSDMPEERKFEKMLKLYYGDLNDLGNILEAVERLKWFYRCGEPDEEENEDKKAKRYVRKTSKEPAYSLSQDTAYIYAAFLDQYGIDLATVRDLHWWKFMALFESLNEDTKMSKIMYYRKASISGMDRERRAFINEMKKLYRIRRGKSEKMTLEQRNERWKKYVRERMNGK